MTDIVQEIENLETLKSLEELWLGKNKITEMKVCHTQDPSKKANLTKRQNLDSLSNLRIISIQSNRLTNLTGLSNLPTSKSSTSPITP
jgi:hypothetical protein